MNFDRGESIIAHEADFAMVTMMPPGKNEKCVTPIFPHRELIGRLQESGRIHLFYNDHMRTEVFGRNPHENPISPKTAAGELGLCPHGNTVS